MRAWCLFGGTLRDASFRLQDASDLGCDARLAGVRSYLAVIVACFAVRAAVLRQVGGFGRIRSPDVFQ